MDSEIVELDEKLLIVLNNLGSEKWDPFWLFITEKWSSVPIYVMLLYLCLKYKKIRYTAITIVFAVALVAITDQISNVFKYGVERLRPCHDNIAEHLRLFRCGGKYGFFSAHAANTFAIATFFSLTLRKNVRWIAVALVCWASVVSYSRIYLAVHYPLDVIAGGVIGSAIAWGVFKSKPLLENKIGEIVKKITKG